MRLDKGGGLLLETFEADVDAYAGTLGAREAGEDNACAERTPVTGHAWRLLSIGGVVGHKAFPSETGVRFSFREVPHGLETMGGGKNSGIRNPHCSSQEGKCNSGWIAMEGVGPFSR